MIVHAEEWKKQFKSHIIFFEILDIHFVNQIYSLIKIKFLFNLKNCKILYFVVYGNFSSINMKFLFNYFIRSFVMFKAYHKDYLTFSQICCLTLFRAIWWFNLAFSKETVSGLTGVKAFLETCFWLSFFYKNRLNRQNQFRNFFYVVKILYRFLLFV